MRPTTFLTLLTLSGAPSAWAAHDYDGPPKVPHCTIVDQLWPAGSIPVCWADEGFDAEKEWVQSVLTGASSWSSAADIEFVGFGSCSESPDGIQLHITESMAFAPLLGRNPDGPTEVFVDFSADIASVEPGCSTLSRRQCVEKTVLRSFGTALGMSVGWIHRDGDRMCPRSDGESRRRDADLYDAISILNHSSERPGLSLTDYLSVLQLYRPSMDQTFMGDLDGDGRQEAIVYDATQFTWQGLRRSGMLFWHDDHKPQLGRRDDIPLVGDLNGDGRDDLVVFRPSTGKWHGLSASDGAPIYAEGSEPTYGRPGDVPLLGNVDGIAGDELVIFRPSAQRWYIRKAMSDDRIFERGNEPRWGRTGDVPLLGDLDGDGQEELTTYRPSTGRWYGLRADLTRIWASGQEPVHGGAEDTPMLAEIDADRPGLELVIWRPATGLWSVMGADRQLIDNSLHWGVAGDVPIVGNFFGPLDDYMVWRPSTGVWYFRSANGATRRAYYYGQPYYVTDHFLEMLEAFARNQLEHGDRTPAQPVPVGPLDGLETVVRSNDVRKLMAPHAGFQVHRLARTATSEAFRDSATRAFRDYAGGIIAKAYDDDLRDEADAQTYRSIVDGILLVERDPRQAARQLVSSWYCLDPHKCEVVADLAFERSTMVREALIQAGFESLEAMVRVAGSETFALNQLAETAVMELETMRRVELHRDAQGEFGEFDKLGLSYLLEQTFGENEDTNSSGNSTAPKDEEGGQTMPSVCSADAGYGGGIFGSCSVPAGSSPVAPAVTSGGGGLRFTPSGLTGPGLNRPSAMAVTLEGSLSLPTWEIPADCRFANPVDLAGPDSSVARLRGVFRGASRSGGGATQGDKNGVLKDVGVGLAIERALEEAWSWIFDEEPGADLGAMTDDLADATSKGVDSMQRRSELDAAHDAMIKNGGKNGTTATYEAARDRYDDARAREAAAVRKAEETVDGAVDCLFGDKGESTDEVDLPDSEEQGDEGQDTDDGSTDGDDSTPSPEDDGQLDACRDAVQQALYECASTDLGAAASSEFTCAQGGEADLDPILVDGIAAAGLSCRCDGNYGQPQLSPGMMPGGDIDPSPVWP